MPDDDRRPDDLIGTTSQGGRQAGREQNQFFSSEAHDELRDPTAMETPVAVISFEGAETHHAERAIPSEVPVNMIYGGIPFAVMMTTPADLEDFAVGFSLTEGVIQHADDIRAIRLEPEKGGLRLHIDLTPDRLHVHLARKRALSGRTGCGLCGIDDLKALPHAPQPQGRPPVLSVSAIRSALLALDREQVLNQVTHAVHAAAWADLDGAIRCVREDVGRHNALDKLIGAIIRAGIKPESGFVIVTSRCSFELVEKVAAFGARALVAISAPTSLALERARHHDIALIAIARRDSIAVFHGIDRLAS